MTKYSMRAISAAAATVAMLAFGMSAQAQTNVTPPGSTNSKDAVMPSPTAGNGATARTAAPGMTEASPTATNKTGNASTTNSKDNISPSPTGGTAKSANERTMSKEDKANAKAAKRASRKAKRTTNSGVDTSAMTPSGAGSSTAMSKSK